MPELVPALAIIAIGALILFSRWRSDRRQLSSSQPHWAAFAREHGLDARLPDAIRRFRLQGSLHHISISVCVEESEEASGWITVLRAECPKRLQGLIHARFDPLGEPLLNRLHPDVQLGIPTLDTRWRIDSHAPSLLQALFADAALRAWAMEGPELGLSHTELRKEARGVLSVELAAFVHDGLQLFRHMRAALDRFEAHLAGQTGLAPAADAPRNLRPLSGTREGVAIALQQPQRDDGLVLRVHIPEPVLPDLRLQPRDVLDADFGTPTHDPILDSQVMAQSQHPEAMRALLCQDPLREHLLALMGSQPSTRVNGATIAVTLPTIELEGIVAAIDDAVALARCLSVRPPATDASHRAVALRTTP